MDLDKELRPNCVLCKGSGSVEKFGFSSSGHMDSGSPPKTITQSCHMCKGRGWVYLSADELTEMVEELRQTLKLRELKGEK